MLGCCMDRLRLEGPVRGNKEIWWLASIGSGLKVSAPVQIVSL